MLFTHFKLSSTPPPRTLRYQKKSHKNGKPTALSWMCSHIFHALDSQVIKQHSDTSVIYYPDWFPTSFNQSLLKPADSERNPWFSPLCLCLSTSTSFCSFAFLSFCLLYSYFPKRLFHVSGPGRELSHRKIIKSQRTNKVV